MLLYSLIHPNHLMGFSIEAVGLVTYLGHRLTQGVYLGHSPLRKPQVPRLPKIKGHEIWVRTFLTPCLGFYLPYLLVHLQATQGHIQQTFFKSTQTYSKTIQDVCYTIWVKLRMKRDTQAWIGPKMVHLVGFLTFFPSS